MEQAAHELPPTAATGAATCPRHRDDNRKPASYTSRMITQPIEAASAPRTALPGFVVAVAILLAGLAVAFTLGRYPIGLADVFDVLMARLTGRAPTVSPAVESVILQVRGPRVLAAALIGAALAVAGTAFQGL